MPRMQSAQSGTPLLGCFISQEGRDSDGSCTRAVLMVVWNDCRLREENDKILQEHAEVVERAQRREDAEAAKHEATCSFQKSDYRCGASMEALPLQMIMTLQDGWMDGWRRP